MSEFSGHVLATSRAKQDLPFPPAVVVVIAVVAILFQIYVPRFLQYLAYLELPLLVTVLLLSDETAADSRSPVRRCHRTGTGFVVLTSLWECLGSSRH